MNAIESIKASLNAAGSFAGKIFSDMADDPLSRVSPTGHHAYWLLGHVVVSEAALLDQYLLDKPNRYADWMEFFAGGTHPQDDYEATPSYNDLLNELPRIRASLMKHVESLSEQDLAKSCCKVDGPGPDFKTVGDCLTAVSQHMSLHAGQVACIRRAVGREPLFM